MENTDTVNSYKVPHTSGEINIGPLWNGRKVAFLP